MEEKAAVSPPSVLINSGADPSHVFTPITRFNGTASQEAREVPVPFPRSAAAMPSATVSDKQKVPSTCERHIQEATFVFCRRSNRTSRQILILRGNNKSS